MPDVQISRWATIPIPLDDARYRERFGNRFRRVGPYVRAAQLGAADVLDPGTPEDLGVYIGTGFANIATVTPLIEAIHHPRAPRCSPLAFARSVGNAAAFFVAQAFELAGENVTVSQEELSFEAALLEAWLALRAGVVTHALVGALDVGEASEDFASQRVRLGAEDLPGTLTSGAAFFLLGPEGSWALREVAVGAMDPLAGVPEEARVLRGWRAGGLSLGQTAPPVETRLCPISSALALAEALSDGLAPVVAHVQQHRSGSWGRVVVEAT